MWNLEKWYRRTGLQGRNRDTDVETWMDLETVIQSEVSQKEKNKYCILTHICYALERIYVMR